MQRESFQNKCLVSKTKALSSTPPNGRFLTSQDFFSLCVFINISIFWRMWSFLDSGHIPLHMEAMNNTITMSKQKLSSPSNPIKIMKLTMKRAKEAVRPIVPIVCLQLWEARPGLHKSLSLWYIMTEVQADWDCGLLPYQHLSETYQPAASGAHAGLVPASLSSSSLFPLDLLKGSAHPASLLSSFLHPGWQQ